MEKYVTPSITLVELKNIDIITTSGIELPEVPLTGSGDGIELPEVPLGKLPSF